MNYDDGGITRWVSVAKFPRDVGVVIYISIFPYLKVVPISPLSNFFFLIAFQFVMLPHCLKTAVVFSIFEVEIYKIPVIVLSQHSFNYLQNSRKIDLW